VQSVEDERDERCERLEGLLALLCDVLSQTPIAGRYWMWGGVLLGWAREGRLLAHDVDADFNYRVEDEQRLQASLPALLQAGFRIARRFPNTEERPTEWALSAQGVMFDFFAVEIEDQRLRWSSYGCHREPPTPLGFVQNICEIRAWPLEEFEFLGRRWLKASDHEAELSDVYGEWRTPDPHWDYMHGRAIVERRPWDPSRHLL
jgi:hypothetical protein